MTLQEAIEEVKRGKESGWVDSKTATAWDIIEDAVASGDLILKADADLAVAEALRADLEATHRLLMAEADASLERLARAEAAEAEVTAMRRSYEELYADALSDAKSDAQDFDGDLWVEVRKYLTELHLDWRDYQEDGIPADQAVEYIRECMDEETRRAEAAEAEVARLRDALKQAEEDFYSAANMWRDEDYGRLA